MYKKLIYFVSFTLVLVLTGGVALADLIIAEELLVDLRAEDLSYGTGMTTWPNHGSLGDFSANGTPIVEDVDGVKAVTFDGSSWFEGPTSAAGIEGAGTRSVEIWAYNPSVFEAEETMLSWAHRGGPVGSNMAFNYCSHAQWGSMAHWGGGTHDMGWWGDYSPAPAANTWWHLAYTYDGSAARVYVNGEEESVRDPIALNTHAGNIIRVAAQADNTGAGVQSQFNFTGSITIVRIHDGVLSAAEIQNNFRGGYLKAWNPDPTNGALHEDTWVNISWRPGAYAVSHDVYLGDNFDDVNNGTEDVFQSNQAATFFVAGFPGFAYPDGLIPGTTYYWRIDEVNDSEPNSPWKGDVWSFSIPPKTAYAPDPADDAESVDPDTDLSWTGGFGSKSHTVYFGDNFDDVNNATGGLPQGTTTYTPGPLKLGKTYYWRVDEFDAVDTHKGDVWSFTTQGAVGSPNPPNGAVDVKQTPILTWTPGAYPASHQVYFGADKNVVKNADISSPEYKGTRDLGSESYDPGKLQWDATYYWRIDEVNNVNPDSPWIGPVWCFTTANFLIVDDFESYNDLGPADPDSNRIFNAWIDGYDNPTNGSLVGYDSPPFAEQTIVHSGNQSMPLYYDNSVGYSEATLALSDTSDWTEEGVVELSLWFRGLPAFVGSFTEGPVGTYTMTGSGADIWDNADEFHYAFKTLTGAGSIVARVQSVSNTNSWAKAGVMIRETLDPGSKHATMVVTPGQGVSFQRRTVTDSGSTDTTTGGISAPHWVKIERGVGSNFSAYHSADGVSWQMQGTPENIQMGSNIYIGLAVTSHDAAQTCEAVFSNVTTTGTVGTQWANQDIGILSNVAEPLYVAVSNAGGAPAVVVHDDPGAATIDTWAEWLIPLQTFADLGVDLTNVDTIALGIGNRNNPLAGGSGTMYFDDIRLYPPAP